jgi:glycosyltransferase involved in cell wall biosynthesis
MPEKACILLSTYNGEKFLRELLDSLLSQSYGNYEIRVRDDGSTDKTRDILSEYSSKYQNIVLRHGSNIGVARSFFDLLENAGDDCTYFAFCDQDDVWMGSKLEKAITMLNNCSQIEPAMYCSNYILCDEKMNLLKDPPSNNHIKPSFSNALLENIAAGCTTVMNKNARSLILKQRPKGFFAHDWWFYLVVSAFGQVIYDPTPTLYYRQHASNVVGAKASMLMKWKSRLSRYLVDAQEGVVIRQTQEFEEIYGTMLKNENKNILSNFLTDQNSIIRRCKYALFGPARRQSLIDNIIFKLLYILKRI